MTRDDLVTQLAAIERTLDDRVVVARIILDPDGRELFRIFRTSFQRPRDSHVGEPHSKETNHE